MRFLKLTIKNFRNISSASLDTDADDIVLTGINGQGKTNLLEVVYILCYGSSFRTDILKECISFNNDSFLLEGSFLNEYGERETIKTSYSNGKRRILIDDKEIKDRKELIYRFPCIIFCHQDIAFINGEMETKRKFFDQMLSLYSPLYLDNSRNYRQLLSQRNAAIKDERLDLVPLYNARLAYYGLEIQREREHGIESFNRIFPSLFKEISGTDLNLTIKYSPSWQDKKSIEEVVDFLESTIERDVNLKTTSSGIHRDRFYIMNNEKNFALFGSTGQLRLCSLIFRISEALFFNEMTNKKPILLIDDVLLELDPEKRGKVLKAIKDYSQAFYTFLPLENYFMEGENIKKYNVVDGGFYAT